MAEDRISRVTDVNGYVLSEEEVRLEFGFYEKGAISFHCPVCRRIVGTGDYKEFVRRRRMFRPVAHHFTSDGQLLAGQQPTEDWEKSIREIFSSCPFCSQRDLHVDIRFERPVDYVLCTSCVARWRVIWKGEDYKIESITLIEDSVDKKGKDFAGRILRPTFWKDLTTNPMKEVTAQDIIKEEKNFVREKRERIRAHNRKKLTLNLALFSLGLAILGIGYEVTASDTLLVVIFILFGGLFMLGSIIGLIHSTKALWYLSPERNFKRMMKEQRRWLREQRKQEERIDRLTLVECPKCHNRYDRFLIENCPNCGERNPKFKDVWKKRKD